MVVLVVEVVVVAVVLAVVVLAVVEVVLVLAATELAASEVATQVNVVLSLVMVMTAAMAVSADPVQEGQTFPNCRHPNQQWQLLLPLLAVVGQQAQESRQPLPIAC